MRTLPLYALIQRRKKRQVRTARSGQQRLGQAALGLGAALAVLIMLVVLIGGAAYVSLTASLPSTAQLPVLLDRQNGLLLQPTQIYDRTGTHLLYTFDNPGIPRRFLSIDPADPNHIDPRLVQSITAVQQPDFWQSSGADWRRLTDPQPRTLAEKIVSSLLLDGEPDGLRRTLRMRLLAAQIVGEFGRAQVLEWYLNSASFGHLTIGADNAARLYLAKSAVQLNLAEVALLLAALDAPALNPIDAPAAALENQQSILEHLKQNGTISSEDFWQAYNNPPDVRPALEQANPPARAFSALVINELSSRYGRGRLERGGLMVTTTLDYDLQMQLSCTLRTQLARLQQRPDSLTLPDGSICEAARLLPTFAQTTAWPADLTASAVITDPASGQILAYVGDTTRSGEQPTLSARAPGSTLSPFLAVAAFARGFSPASLVWDIPPAGESPTSATYHGPVRLRIALANDYLAAETSLLNQIGASTVWRSAQPFGLRSLAASPNPADILTGGGQLTPLELAHAYSVFANQGISKGILAADGIPAPVSFLSVEDTSGQRLLDQSQSGQLAVLSTPLAYLVHHVLSDEAARWPSLGYPNALEIGRPAGARTASIPGTNQTWATGYTQRFSTSVWLGLPGEASSQTLDVRLAAGIWHAAMLYAERDLPVQDWTMPSGISSVEVCDPSGLLPGRSCPNRVTEIFLAGSEPTTTDTLYRSYSVNRETGRLANVFTPAAWIEDRTYLIVPPQAQAWARQAGLPEPPTAYDTIQAPPALPNVNISQPGLFTYVSGQVNLVGTASGTDFASYKIQVGQGIQPAAWIQVGEESTRPAINKTLAVWDTTAAADGLYAVRLLVVHKNAEMDTAVIQVTVDNTPPQVQINYPAAGQSFSAAQESQLTLLAAAQDTLGIERVEWWLDGIRIGERSQEPYSLPWKVSTGTHTLSCVVYDLAGNRANSDKIVFTVKK